MSGWAIFAIISLVLGIIVSNIMLLKHTANMKLPTLDKDTKAAIKEHKCKAEETNNNNADN